MAANLAYFWYKLVYTGVKNIDDVPEKYKEEVIRMLEENPPA